MANFFLGSTKYSQYLNLPKNRKTFCEGFFITSFSKNDGRVIDGSETFPPSCLHKECSRLPPMKPEITFKYPLNNINSLEINNLIASICFQNGIKVCYNENNLNIIEDYATSIINQKSERYYMMNYHFYLKIRNDIYSK